MNVKEPKKYNNDSDPELYDSPDEDDDVNDFYYLKRKEDRLAELIMNNYQELSNQVCYYCDKYLDGRI